MKKILLFAVIAMIGCVNSPDSPVQSPGYLSTEIKEGYSWRYLYIWDAQSNKYTSIFYSDIYIDSVWKNSLGTLFFTVTKIDSVIQKSKYDSSSYSFVQTNKITCRKTGIQTFCSDDLLHRVFSDKEYIQYDNRDIMYDSSSYMIHIQFGERCFKTVENATSYLMGPGDRQSTYTLFADTIGVISGTYSGSGKMIKGMINNSIDLLKYNGTDFSYTTASFPE